MTTHVKDKVVLLALLAEEYPEEDFLTPQEQKARDRFINLSCDRCPPHRGENADRQSLHGRDKRNKRQRGNQ